MLKSADFKKILEESNQDDVNSQSDNAKKAKSAYDRAIANMEKLQKGYKELSEADKKNEERVEAHKKTKGVIQFYESLHPVEKTELKSNAVLDSDHKDAFLRAMSVINKMTHQVETEEEARKAISAVKFFKKDTALPEDHQVMVALRKQHKINMAKNYIKYASDTKAQFAAKTGNIAKKVRAFIDDSGNKDILDIPKLQAALNLLEPIVPGVNPEALGKKPGVKTRILKGAKK